jgi:hypothetical protein
VYLNSGVRSHAMVLKGLAYIVTCMLLEYTSNSRVLDSKIVRVSQRACPMLFTPLLA